MTFPELFCIAVGGAAGALCRHGISTYCAGLFRDFPFGTLAVNILGSTLMGILAGCGSRWGSTLPVLFIGGGFLGALTTFSTFAMDTFATFRDSHPWKAIANILLNVTLSFFGVAAGFAYAAN